MYKQIEQMIKSKNRKMDLNTLRYFTNYFYVVFKRDVLPENISLEELIDKTLYFVKKIVFYDYDHKMFEKLGPDVKGTFSPIDKTIYVRGDLEEPLREMIVYHEIHHAAQTNRKTKKIGINEKESKGSLILEAQTQWFAEEIYKEIYDVNFGEVSFPSHMLRMNKGGTVTTSLHNYEVHDNMLTKLAIILDVSKEYFVTINYLNEEGFKLLKEKYEEKAKEKNISYPFNELLYLMDYVYIVDYFSYINNPNKSVLLSGGKTTSRCLIYPNKAEALSLSEQFRKIEAFDMILILALIEGGYDFSLFAKYVVSNEKRKVLNDYFKNKTK